MIRNNANKGRPALPPISVAEAQLWEMQAEICQTLANPKRLHILHLLREDELSVGSIVKAMGITKANLSQHLSIMRQKGILTARREGTTVYYRLAIPYITEACGIMRKVLREVLSARGQVHRSLTTPGPTPGSTAPADERDMGEDIP
jgi:ArsR family transcriptional regulator, virulence genes transcriptional regulator